MDSIIAIIFGVVQGLTEFIPVSSSGHLVLLHELLPPLPLSDETAFDVALHVGTLAALLIVFFSDCIRYVRAAFSRGFFRIHAGESQTDDQRMARLILVAILPAGIVGFFFEDIIDTIFRSWIVVVVMLIVIAILFLIVEHWYSRVRQKTLATLSWKQALCIGTLQSIALIPGTSRSGITIVAGMLAQLSREQAARFSFLIAIPLVAAAGLKKTADLFILGVPSTEIPLLLLGIISSAVVGYLAIRFLLRFIQTHTLRPFAIYRIILAIIVLIISL